MNRISYLALGLFLGLGMTAYAATSVSLTRDHVLQYLNYIGDAFVVGNTATTTASRLEVNGTTTALLFTATSTTATSTLPQLSTTQIKVGALSGIIKAVGGMLRDGATTADLPELTNLYFTNERARDAVAGLFLASSSPWTNGQVAYVSNGGLTSRSTTTATCSGSVSCTTFDIFGSAPVTISGGALFAYPFPNNATSSELSFDGISFSSATGTSIIALASSTVQVLNSQSASTSALTVNGTIAYNGGATSTWANGGLSLGGGGLHVTNGGARIANLASCDTIDTDTNGVLRCGTDAGALFAYLFPNNATSSELSFDGISFSSATGTSIIATASSTVQVLNSQTASTSGLTVNGTLAYNGGATSSWPFGGLSLGGGGLHLTNGGLRVANLASCDTIDTDTNGVLRCGTDAGASFAYPFPNNATSSELSFDGISFSSATGTSIITTASSTIQIVNSQTASTSALTVSNTLAYNGGATSTWSFGGLSLGGGGLHITNGGLRVANLNAASCDVKASTAGVLSCGTDATGGGGASDNMWATSTQYVDAIYPNVATRLGIGTSTPWGTLHVASTSPFIVLNKTNAGVNAKNAFLTWDGTSFILGTTTDTGYTSTSTMVTFRGGAGTSTFPNGIRINGGCYAIGSTCLGVMALNGTVGQVNYYSGINTAVGTSSIFIDTNERVGISTTTPGTMFAIGATGAGINLTGAGTSTFAKGINLVGGCFAINGTCVGGGTGGASSGISGAVQFSDGASGFLSDATNLFWDDTNNRLGIGSSTPWARLSVVGSGNSIFNPLFAVATSTTALSIFNVYATSTVFDGGLVNERERDRGGRLVVNNAWNATNMSMNAPLYVNGHMDSNWASLNCERPAFAATLTADTVNVCPGFIFNEDATGEMTFGHTLGNQWYAITEASAATNDGASLFVAAGGANATWRLSTSTPVVETVVAIGNTGTGTAYYWGFVGNDITAAALETAPTVGCYWAATSTNANWRAVCQTSAANYTQWDTGVASSTLLGNPRKLRIEVVPGGVKFLIATTSTQYLEHTITTNLPSTNNLYLGAYLGHSTQSTTVVLSRSRYMRFNYTNIFWRKGPFENVGSGLYLPM